MGLAGRRLPAQPALRSRRSACFVLIVLVSLLAPVYAHHIAHTTRSPPTSRGRRSSTARRCEVIQQGGGKLGLGETPIGPTWQTNYFIGADSQGRDVMARVLYGGRASL